MIDFKPEHNETNNTCACACVCVCVVAPANQRHAAYR